MIRIERILTGIDLGPDTEMVLAYAFFFGKLFNASIDLLYVIDYLTTPPSYMIPYIEEERLSALKSMEKWQGQLGDRGIKTRSEVIVGRLYESFDFSLKNRKVDLLVLGFRSHPLRRSSSEKLVKGLSILMLVVRGEKSKGMRIGDVRIRNIICPVDFSEHSKKALTIASNLSSLLQERLDILHVLPVHLLKGKDDKKMKAIVEMKEEAEKRLKDLTEGLNIPSGKVHILTGEPYGEIISYSKENDADLIIMGARGLGLIRGMILGSVTDAVVRSSPCPVMIIH